LIASPRSLKVWEEILGLLTSQVELKGIGVEVGFAKLALELRNRPGSRDLLRQAVEQHNTSLLTAVNDLLDAANAAAHHAGQAGLVLIIDGLDKLVRRDLGNGDIWYEINPVLRTLERFRR